MAVLLVALGALAAAPGAASARGICLILLGCRPEAPVVTPPPPAADPCLPLPRNGRGAFVGLVSEDVFWYGGSYRSCNLNQQAASGVDILRQSFDWARIEIRRGSYDFSLYDRLVSDTARRGMRVLPVLFNAPRFRSSGGRRSARLPRRNEDFGRFAARLVHRYGPRGRFWRDHPDVPRIPIRSWQIWNEPNLRAYWPSGPDPVAYTRLLATAARHVKRADRRAEVVTAGIADSRQGIPFATFAAAMYRAGAGRSFDTLAINAYSRFPSGVTGFARRARRLMDRSRDRRGRLWVTEFGWATAGPSSPYRVSPNEHARRLSWTLRSLYGARRQLRLRGAVYYNWRDGRPYPPLFQDFFGLYTGLLEVGGGPKPALRAFRELAPRLH